MEEVFLHFLSQSAAIFVVGVGVEVSNHSGLGMSRVALYRFDIAAADLQFQRGAAVAQTMKYHRFQVMFTDQRPEQGHDLALLIGAAVLVCDD